MSLLFDSGSTIVRVDPKTGESYEEAVITVSNLPSLACFVLDFSTTVRMIHNASRTLADSLYYQSFGTSIDPIAIRGITYNPDAQCGNDEVTYSDTATGLNIVLDFFHDYKAKGGDLSVIEITSGQTTSPEDPFSTIKGLLIGAQVSYSVGKKGGIPLFEFTLEILPFDTAPTGV